MRPKSFRAAVAAAVFGFAAAGGAGQAFAYERVPYTNVAIDAVRESGQPYIIYVHADWCTTCQAQDRVLETLVDDPRFADLTIVQVDYDTQQHIMRILNIPDRSTFVAYVARTERQRSWADTTPAGIEQFLVDTMALQ